MRIKGKVQQGNLDYTETKNCCRFCGWIRETVSVFCNSE